ncbi:MAG: TetR/AcrR family transcriptional regulator [Armatimonas sp.]
MRKPEKFEELLKAAHNVVMRDGIARLTLDLVAREAGVSKGAVLYYFPTKNALIGGLINSGMDCHYAAWQQQIAQEPIGPGRAIRAMLKVHVCPPDGMEERGGAGMLAAVANDPELLAIIRTRITEWEEILLNDELDPTTTLLIRLALDGLKFNDLMGVRPPSAEARRKVIDLLLELATPSSDSLESPETNE